MPYPSLRLLNPSDAIALVLPSIASGDLPVICEFNGVCRQIGSIQKSALCINQLRKITNLEFIVSKDVVKPLQSTQDIMEVLM